MTLGSPFRQSKPCKPLPDEFGKSFTIQTRKRKSPPRKDDEKGVERFHDVKVYAINRHWVCDPECINTAPPPDEWEEKVTIPLILRTMRHKIVHKIANDPHHKEVRFLTYRYSSHYEKFVKIKEPFLIAIAGAIDSMLQHYSLAYGMVGYLNDEGKFSGYTIPYLANQAVDTSEWQFKRVLVWLRRKGVMVTENLCTEHPDGSFTGMASLKHIPKHFFAAFGFDNWLPHERKKAQLRATQEKENPQPKTKKEEAVQQMSADAAKRYAFDALGMSTPKLVDEKQPI